MTARKPLVLNGGSLQQLQSGDVIPASALDSTVTSAGAGSAGKVPVLDAGGKIDATALPTVGSAAASALAWPVSTAVAGGELRTLQQGTSSQGVLLLKSSSARTTGSTFNATEASNWTVVSQDNPLTWVTGWIVLPNTIVQRLGAGVFEWTGSAAALGATFDADSANWSRVRDDATVASVGNQATNASVSAADSGQVIAFAQTTTGITITLSSPTAAGSSAAVARSYWVQNTGSAAFLLVAGTVSIAVGPGQLKDLYWNGSVYVDPHPAGALLVCSDLLRPVVGGNTTTTAVTTSGQAVFLYLGRTAKDMIINYVCCQVNTAGAGTQTAEVGLYSSASEPASLTAASIALTRIVATGTVDALTATGVRRNTTAFAQFVAAGTYLWVAQRVAMVTTQPSVSRSNADPTRSGALCTISAASALTSLASVAAGGATVSAYNTGVPYVWATT